MYVEYPSPCNVVVQFGVIWCLVQKWYVRSCTTTGRKQKGLKFATRDITTLVCHMWGNYL